MHLMNVPEGFFGEAVDTVGVGVGFYGPDGRFTYVNEAYADLFGVDREDLLGTAVWEINPEFDRKRFDAYWDSFADGESRSAETHHEFGGRSVAVSVVTTCRTFDDQRYHFGTIQDISERKAYEQELQTQRDRLELLNEVVRHDVRNDMQVIDGWAELLGDHVDEEGAELLDEIHRATDHAIALTETTRELTETMLHPDRERRPIALPAVVEDEIGALRSRYDHVSVGVEGAIPSATVLADEMLNSVLRNLLDNAVIHNDKPTPEVVVSASCSGETVRLAVADNGPGLTESHREKIFRKGQRSPDSSGTGLGLYLVGTLVDQYGGNIHIEDNDPKGSVFVIELPVADSQPDAALP